ncbi:hypothetical protein SAMN05421823_11189 [Catalinimonas alkaloidigena]|uniref:Uncharacterized protein n=1 Tax=Catalinimonas alkaloidigena TaxID=1075417 RepID=A0A1G9R9X2_9BACT|nr:hypothetical protein [Catalinimonas alkaloidigena]SDM20122.1 hypothetical protein SAMN05421823_11189 [Catalinimonas alkaloidigena]
MLLVLGLLMACATPPDPPFPSTVTLPSGERVTMGMPPPGSATGRIRTFEYLHLPDGAERLVVEVDSLNRAVLFEFYYPAGTQYPTVVHYHLARLGSPVRRYARPAGECTVWQHGGYDFEVCRSREPTARPDVIAHVWPTPR